MPKRNNTPQNVAERLAVLLQVKGTIPYHENVPDKEYSDIICSIFGAPETNELFVKLTNDTDTFIEAIKSPHLSPPMTDRIFGMDVLDNAVAFDLADQMWEKHKMALIAKPSAGGTPP